LTDESLIRSERKRKRFNWKWSREVGIEANIDKQSKLLSYNYNGKMFYGSGVAFTKLLMIILQLLFCQGTLIK
jgi:hypothetical protein